MTVSVDHVGGIEADSRPEFATFCYEQHPRLVGMLSLYCGDVHLAHDLAQETLARACHRWSQVQTMDSPSAWVHRVALNLARSAFRTSSRRRAAVERLQARSDARTGQADPADAVAVRDAVAKLPERMRRALVLRYYADLPVADVAELMTCPEGTVKTLTFQAIAALRAAGLEVTE